jgi:hypothetical protein
MLYQFVSVCVSILLEAKVIHAMIEGVKNCGDIGIEFSKDIPSSIDQSLRNVWSVYNPY